MNPVLAIISDDIIFFKLFETPLIRKISNLNLILCKSYEDIDQKLKGANEFLILLDDFRASISSIEIIRHLRISIGVVSPIWFFPEIKTNPYAYKSYEMGANKILYRPFDPFRISDEIAELWKKNNQ